MQPVGSGSTDSQRVGFPIGSALSGYFDTTVRLPINNPATLLASAENSGAIVFVGVEVV